MDPERFQAIDMVQTVTRNGHIRMETTRCPIRVDGEVLKASRGAPRVGEQTEALLQEFLELASA